MRSLQEVRLSEVEIEIDLKKAQETTEKSGLCEKSLTEQILSLTVEMSTVRV